MTSHPTQNIMVKLVTIKDIRLHNKAQRNLPSKGKYYIRISVGDTSCQTEIAEEAENQTSWDDILYLDGDINLDSNLVICVYEKHDQQAQDEWIGTRTDTIGKILEILSNHVLEDAPLTNPFDRDVPSPMTIGFSMTAEDREAASTHKRQAIDATTTTNEASSTLQDNSVVSGSPSVEVGSQSSKAFETIWCEFLKKLQDLNNVASDLAEVHPYMALAWSVISAANRILMKQQAHDEQTSGLAGTMHDILKFTHGPDPLKMIKEHTKAFTLLIQQVTGCGYFITQCAKQDNIFARMAIRTLDFDVDEIMTDYQTKLRQLKTVFSEGVTVQMGITVIRMMNPVEDSEEKPDLNNMLYAKGARFEQEKGCLSGTREAFLQEICDVLNNPDEDAPHVCLLTGVAGSGKSAVAHSIARLYEEQQRLGSSYCFNRSDTANRNSSNLFSTIARDLCDRDPQYRCALWEVVKGNLALCTSRSPIEQVERFIIEPLQKLDPIGPLIIVIDALNEAGDVSRRRDLLRALSEKIATNAFPSHLRFLITARPETDILRLPLRSQIVHKQMENIPVDSIDKDIEKFIHHSLNECIMLEPSWPDQNWCRLLADRSEKLFQWASAACNFIRDGGEGVDLRERFKMLVDNRGALHLDDLYQAILEQHFTSDDARHRFREVMAVILALKEPLSISSLSILCGERLNVRGIIKPLGSLLDGVVDEEKPIQPLHSSFRDFLLDEARGGTFYVKVLPRHSYLLGQAAVEWMRKMLRFNICDLKDSRIRNSAVSDIADRVNMAIPSHLAYSCCYWMYHLRHADCSKALLAEVTTFFKDYFPYWLEVISLLSLSPPHSSIQSAFVACKHLGEWAKGHEVATLASEAFQFIEAFDPVLRESIPHLYLSAMPQTPTRSPLCQLWNGHLQKHVSVNSGRSTNWPASAHAMSQTSTGSIFCQLWIECQQKHNLVNSGHSTNHPATSVHSLYGHTRDLTSVAYSPNGTHIASGSNDDTIRVWDALTGQPVAGPFLGHTHSITSVAYSPNGLHIISGSKDGTIRVWDAITGQHMAGPFQGHTDWITSVAYSPNGMHITSGFWDNTIRVWDATTGHPKTSLFKGHTSFVTSVAYSPDGLYIASGSHDNTIRVWDAITGWHVAGPFKGHTSWVTSVAYSPDGTHIASGSRDSTIGIWNALTGLLLAGPLQGHTHCVRSVAYSPDGLYIASGSDDNTIRIWNPVNGQCVAGPFQVHANGVKSLVFSPDGTYIVSSDNHSIKVFRIQDLLFFHNLFNEDGWIQSFDGSCFAWIAPWHRNTFHLPCQSLLIQSGSSYSINVDKSLFGESWVSCWL